MTTIDTTPEQGQAFLSRDADAPVAMLNLLKFKDKATYMRRTAPKPVRT